MKKIITLTTLVLLFVTVIPASAAPPEEKQCDIWLRVLDKILQNSPNYQKVFDNYEANCVISEYDALVALYESTDGANWANSTGWLDLQYHYCTWFGVYCDDTETRVISLSLDWNGLNGILPSELGNLSSIQYLNLGDNQISGPIPPELGNLSSLETLSLIANELTGTIPPELGNLSNLEYLNLSLNQLDGSITPDLEKLSSLSTLNLRYNKLAGFIPAELGNIASLNTLYLENNQLGGPIPDSLSKLTVLDIAHLHDNDPSLCVETSELLDFLTSLWDYDGPTTICGTRGSRD